MEYTVEFPGLGWEMTIDRVAFTIGDFPIYWYGILIGVGLLTALLFALKKSDSFGVDSDKLLDVVFVAAIAGVIGARLYYVVFSPSFKLDSFMDILDIRDGGLGFYGAVIFALGSAYFLCRWRRINFLATSDMTAIGFLIGQGIGRWGNFVNQEAFGTNTTLPWGMISAQTTSYLQLNAAELAERGIVVDPNLPVHPTFLYESLWCIVGAVLLMFYIKHRKFDGEILLMYIAWNGVGRAFIEGMRTDSLYIGPLRVSQLLAIVGALAAVIAIIAIRRKIKLADDPNYLIPYANTAEWQQEYAAMQDKKAMKKQRADGNAAQPETNAPQGVTENPASDAPGKTVYKSGEKGTDAGQNSSSGEK